ncbi:MAG: lasso peptide biosynthesis B2 protein [Caldilineaceae bacterium]
MSWTNSLRKLSACSGGDRWLLLQAAAWLGALRAAILVLPFRRIARLMGLAPGENSAADPAQVARAVHIGWAVRTVAPRTPWQSVCLAQALAGAFLLRQRDLPGTVYLGVAKEGSAANALTAHAWLRCGDAILTGAAGRERYTVIAAFSWPPGSCATR